MVCRACQECLVINPVWVINREVVVCAVISPGVVACRNNKPDMTMMTGANMDTATTSTSIITITDIGTDTAASRVDLASLPIGTPGSAPP